jgi:hypothetical protein
MMLTGQTDLMPPNELIMAIIPSNYIPNETKCDCPFTASAVELDRREMARQEAGTLSKQLSTYCTITFLTHYSILEANRLNPLAGLSSETWMRRSARALNQLELRTR